MNHHCHGDRLKIDGEIYYRCFLDGTLTPGDAPTTCGVCKCQVEINGGIKDCGKSYLRRMYNYPIYDNTFPEEMRLKIDNVEEVK